MKPNSDKQNPVENKTICIARWNSFQECKELKKLRNTSVNIKFLKAFDCVDNNKLWKILQEMGISDHLTWLLRNVYIAQEATIGTRHGTTDWFEIGKGVRQGCILSLYLFNLYAEYIRQNARLDEAQTGIKISRRNIKNLKYTDDTTLMAETEEELNVSWWEWKRRLKNLA